MGEKRCPKCDTVKPFSEFYKNSHSKTNTSPYCKVCSNLRTTSYAKDNKDKINPKLFGYALKRRYGITPEQFKMMLDEQDGKCAICGVAEDPTGRNFAVDHCHDTNTIRGLLCSNCNTGLGMFKDCTVTLDSAIDYLLKYK